MRLTLIALAVLVATAVAGPALAHQPAVVPAPTVPAPTVPAPTVAVDAAPVATDMLVAGGAVPGVDVVALVALAVGLLGLACLPRVPRRALGLVLIVGLSVVAFEAGVHSVHHLGEAQASCTVAAGTAQLHGTAPTPVADGVLVAPAAPLLSSEPLLPTGTLLQPSPGRSPPIPA